MRITAAITKEQGVTFTVVLVKSGVINSSSRRSDIIQQAPRNFPRPIILAEQKSGSRMEYYGRKDIVKFLSHITYDSLPWKEYGI